MGMHTPDINAHKSENMHRKRWANVNKSLGIPMYEMINLTPLESQVWLSFKFTSGIYQQRNPGSIFYWGPYSIVHKIWTPVEYGPGVHFLWGPYSK